jgi:ABC-type multidrug transport system fused ATPase/permease subunit
VLELLDKKPLVQERAGARPLPTATGRVELSDATFRYPDAAGPVLKNFSLRLEPGEVLALAGPSGSGKSTVARLLLRYADPESGSVHLDGHDLRELTIASVRDNIGILLQETMVFDASVADNIRFGRPGATAAQIETAARNAGAHEFICALPGGYDSRVGQRGRSLSGGQRRRIEIARTLLRETPIVVLDEPTTGLDAEAAAGVIQPLKALLHGRTALIISHDPALLECADRVVQMDGVRPEPVGAT